MKKQTLIALALMVLSNAGLADVHSGHEESAKWFESDGSDGYHFLKKSHDKKDIVIEIVIAKTQTQFQELIREFYTGDGNTETLISFSVSTDDVCTIYIMDPVAQEYRPELLGHEFSHCAWGDWHN